jgi:Pyrimidine dimer DNA glycosylase
MNIFVLDTDVVKCAQYHLDKHCVKMILESTQLLNNALITHSMSYAPIYRLTHKNHPASIWTSLSRENFDWLTDLGLALCDEYTYRYGKTHKCQEYIQHFKDSHHRLVIPCHGLMPFVKCMPDHYKVVDPVESYRNYYRGDKAYIARWTKRSTPEWWDK